MHARGQERWSSNAMNHRRFRVPCRATAVTGLRCRAPQAAQPADAKREINAAETDLAAAKKVTDELQLQADQTELLADGNM